MIVADAGPLIIFARIGYLELLRQVVATIHIPQAVYDEITRSDHERPGVAEIERGDWIYRHAARDETALFQFPPALHHGERQAIILAQDLGLALLIDEQRGRTSAKNQGLTVVGSLWVLSVAKQRGYIERVKPFVMAMLAAGYRFDQALLESFLRSVGEHE